MKEPRDVGSQENLRPIEMEMWMEGLDRRDTSSGNEHQLVLGPAGSGKRTFLRHAVAEMNADPVLAGRYHPVWVPETQEPQTVGQLWQAVADQLDEDRGRAPGPARTGAQDDRMLRDLSLAAIAEHAGEVEKGILIVVPDFASRLDRLIGSWDASWILRHPLQQMKSITLWGGALTRVRGFRDPKHALYNGMRERVMHPMNEPQAKAIWIREGNPEPRDEDLQAVHEGCKGNAGLIVETARAYTAGTFSDVRDAVRGAVRRALPGVEEKLQLLEPEVEAIWKLLAQRNEGVSMPEIREETGLEGKLCTDAVYWGIGAREFVYEDPKETTLRKFVLRDQAGSLIWRSAYALH